MTEFNRIQAFRYLDGVADGLNESRKDIIEELEKIKAEINQIDTHQFNRTKVLKILDNHIKENKQ